MYVHLGICLVILNAILSSAQQCDPFVEIPESDYDRTYSDITAGDNGARPLGFLKSTLRYQFSQKPCFSVTGESQQNVEVKFETVPSMKLCVRDKNSNYERCAEGRMTDCATLTQATADLEFYCDLAEGCAEGDVNFWVRLTKGPAPANDTEGMWCHNLSEEYPETLRPLPPQFTPKPKDETSDNGATTPVMSLLLSAVTTLVAIILC